MAETNTDVDTQRVYDVLSERVEAGLGTWSEETSTKLEKLLDDEGEAFAVIGEAIYDTDTAALDEAVDRYIDDVIMRLVAGIED